MGKASEHPGPQALADLHLYALATPAPVADVAFVQTP